MSRSIRFWLIDAETHQILGDGSFDGKTEDEILTMIEQSTLSRRDVFRITQRWEAEKQRRYLKQLPLLNPADNHGEEQK